MTTPIDAREKSRKIEDNIDDRLSALSRFDIPSIARAVKHVQDGRRLNFFPPFPRSGNASFLCTADMVPVLDGSSHADSYMLSFEVDESTALMRPNSVPFTAELVRTIFVLDSYLGARDGKTDLPYSAPLRHVYARALAAQRGYLEYTNATNLVWDPREYNDDELTKRLIGDIRWGLDVGFDDFKEAAEEWKTDRSLTPRQEELFGKYTTNPFTFIAVREAVASSDYICPMIRDNASRKGNDIKPRDIALQMIDFLLGDTKKYRPEQTA